MIDLTSIGLPGYFLDEEEVVIIGKTGKPLNQKVDRFGYKVFYVEIPGVSETQRVHRVVALACVPNPKPGVYTQVLHKDDNKLNCHPSNLQWGTSQQNNWRSNPSAKKYIPQHGKGQNNHAVRKDKAEIMEALSNGVTVTECVRLFHVGWNTVKRYQRELAMECND